MPKLRVQAFGLSLDGYGAGPRQSLNDPMGAGGMALHQWILPTRTFKATHADLGMDLGRGEGTTGVDDDFCARGLANLGAWIIGRNMFGPSRGPWPDDGWKGWWGENPPFHAPVFVLTHHARAPLVMQGGTTFHFITGGIRDAYDRAMAAAGAKDVRLGGGVNTVRQYLTARLVDEMHLAIARAVLGAGEPLFDGLDLPALGYTIAEHVHSPAATHVVFRRAG